MVANDDERLAPGDGVNERLDDDLKVFLSVVGALCSTCEL